MKLLKQVKAFHDPHFIVGARIAANWGKTTKPGEWMLATVTSIASDGSFDIAYDAGQKATYPETAAQQQRVVLLRPNTRKRPTALTWAQLAEHTDVVSLHVSAVVAGCKGCWVAANFFSVQEVRERERDKLVKPGAHDVDILRKQQQDNHDVLATSNYDKEVLHRLWTEINNACFDGELTEPLMILTEPSLNHLMADVEGWHDSIGDVLGYCDQDPDTQRIVILLVAGMTARELIEVMAHEMVHQHLAQTHGYAEMCKIGHSPAFYAYAPQIKRYWNTTLIAPGH